MELVVLGVQFQNVQPAGEARHAVQNENVVQSEDVRETGNA